MPHVEHLMRLVVESLPEMKRYRRDQKTIREVCLTFDGVEWSALAGGHSSVHIGEWGGDYGGSGSTPEEALLDCLRSIEAELVKE